MLQACNDVGIRMVTDLVDIVIKKCTVPDSWLKSVIVNVHEKKGDELECGY